MATRKHIDAVCLGITVLTLLLTILFMNGKALGIQAVAGEENSDAMFTENDLNAAWDTAGATKITLSDEGSTVSGNGAYVYQGDIHIVYGGKYVLSGTLSDGSVIIEADGDDKIWLLLDQVSLHCREDAALRVEQAGKVFLTLGEGTENTLSSGPSYSEEAVSAGVDGTVYSRDDLTINGTGSLQVTAEYQHGIVCNDDFAVTGGRVSVTAPQDAIHANDSVRLCNGALTLSAGDDGITASNDEGTGFLYVESGTVTIPACCEGLEAVQVTIAGGTLDIAATDDGINANGSSGNSVIRITGGEITVTVENGRDADGLDSNQDLYISGGKVLISVNDSGGSCALDYGRENGGKCEISGGTVLACGSSGMAEGFDAASPQGFLMETLSGAAGTKVTVQDANGGELLSETVPCAFSSLLVSTPEMQVGDTCTLTVGTEEREVTITNTEAAAAGGFGGFGGFGGGRGPMAEQTGENSGTPPEGRFPGDREGNFPQEGDSNIPGGFGGGQEGNFPQEGDSNIPSGFGGGQEGNFPQEGDSNMPGGFGGGGRGDWPGRQEQENVPSVEDSGTPVSQEAWLLLGLSVLVLLVGCGVAWGYRRRG